MAKVNYLKYLEEADQERARAIYETVKDAPASDWDLLLKVDRAGEHLRRLMQLAFKELERFGKNIKFYSGTGPEAWGCKPLSTTISGLNTNTGHPDTPIGELITVATALRVSRVTGFELQQLDDAEWLVELWLNAIFSTMKWVRGFDLQFTMRKLFRACRVHAKNLDENAPKQVTENSRIFLRGSVNHIIASADQLRGEIERHEKLARTVLAAEAAAAVSSGIADAGGMGASADAVASGADPA